MHTHVLFCITGTDITAIRYIAREQTGLMPELSANSTGLPSGSTGRADDVASLNGDTRSKSSLPSGGPLDDTVSRADFEEFKHKMQQFQKDQRDRRKDRDARDRGSPYGRGRRPDGKGSDPKGKGNKGGKGRHSVGSAQHKVDATRHGWIGVSGGRNGRTEWYKIDLMVDVLVRKFNVPHHQARQMCFPVAIDKGSNAALCNHPTWNGHQQADSWAHVFPEGHMEAVVQEHKRLRLFAPPK